MTPLANAIFWWAVESGRTESSFDDLVAELNRRPPPSHRTILAALGELERAGLLRHALDLDGVSCLRITASRHQLSALRSVFVVHGHDETLLAEVDAFLLRVGLTPIMLRLQPNAGRTVLEKIEAYSDVQFAICLLTPDDVGSARDATDGLRPRARQNVVLELGYFIGRLGRDRVHALHRGDLELPSDYHGVVFTPTDRPNADWRIELYRELRTSGVPVSPEGLL